MGVLRVLLAGLVLAMASVPAGASASAQEALTEADRAAIVSVIRRQLDAFQADRGIEAFSYAAPGIQRQFGTPERFMEMVRTGYPLAYRARSVHFLTLVTGGGAPTQRVLLV